MAPSPKWKIGFRFKLCEVGGLHFRDGAKFAKGTDQFGPSEPAQLHLERLDLGLKPDEVARSLADEEGLCVLMGEWSGSGAIIAWDPVLDSQGVEDPFSILDKTQVVLGKKHGAVGGGWIGHIGYQAGQLIEELPPQPKTVIPLPLHSLNYYDHLLRFDDPTQAWYFEALLTPARRDAIFHSRDSVLANLRLPNRPTRSNFEVGDFIATPTRDFHIDSVRRAIEYIGSGDIFQANITHRIEAEFEGSPLELFLQGEQNLNPAFAAFISRSWGAVASFSPELFIKRNDRTVITSPIKGTAARNSDPVIDELARRDLSLSEKNRAENLMIVDLMRNDFGRVCNPGSIRVDNLFDVVAMAGVWHMVSTVTGELSDGITDGGLLSATFPPGSVTGAPKLRAQEIISELEHSAREVYTGSIVLASPVSGLSSSVVIRTFEIANGKIWCGIGGGIVADSDPEDEYQECQVKAGPILAAIGAKMSPPVRLSGSPLRGSISIDRTAGVFETLGTLNGVPLDLDAHLNRLAMSVFSLYGEFPPIRLAAIQNSLAEVPQGRGRLRIVVRKVEGELEISMSCAPLDLKPSDEGISMVPIQAPGGLGKHKWLDRRAIDDLAIKNPGFVPLLLDGDKVLEASRSNIFAVCGEEILTPALDGRILAGITRARVIKLLTSIGERVIEADLTVVQLKRASEVFLTNSLRSVETVNSCEELGSWSSGPVTSLARKLLDHHYLLQVENIMMHQNGA